MPSSSKPLEATLGDLPGPGTLLYVGALVVRPSGGKDSSDGNGHATRCGGAATWLFTEKLARGSSDIEVEDVSRRPDVLALGVRSIGVLACICIAVGEIVGPRLGSRSDGHMAPKVGACGLSLLVLCTGFVG